MRGLTANDRADAIVNHYYWIDRLKESRLAQAMTGAQEQPIAQFHVKDGVTYMVNASSAGKAEREGESTLWLRDNEDTLLASLTFSVARSNLFGPFLPSAMRDTFSARCAIASAKAVISTPAMTNSGILWVEKNFPPSAGSCRCRWSANPSTR